MLSRSDQPRATDDGPRGNRVRSPHWTAALLAFAGVAVVGAAVFSFRSAANARYRRAAGCEVALGYRIGGRVGESRRYQLNYSGDICSEGGCTNLVSIRGELLATTRSAKSGCDESVALQLLASLPADPEQARLQRSMALATTMTVQYSSRGSVTRVAFAEQVDAPTARMLESVVRELQVVGPAARENSKNWETVENLVLGDVKAQYVREPDARAVNWRRTRVLEWAEDGGPFIVRGGSPDIAGSNHSAKLDSDGFVFELSGIDEFSLASEIDSVKMRLKVSTQLKAIPLDDASRKQIAQLAEDSEVPAIAEPAARSKYADDARIAGHSLQSVLAECSRLRKLHKDSSGPGESRLHIAASALFRRDATAAREAVNLARSGHPEQEFLLAAVGDAGTRESAALLAELLRSAGDQKLQANTLGALGRAKEADLSVVDALAPTLRAPGVGGFARLMTGAFANGTLSVSPDTSKKAVEVLIRTYDMSEDVMKRADTLRGLGNSGSVLALELARKAAQSDSSVERAAAAQAVRLMPTDAADQMLGGMLKDNDAFVRRSVLDAALYRDATELLVPAVERIARADTEASVRREAIRVLVRWKKDAPTARATLVWVAQNDPEADLKKIAAEGLSRFAM